jgi:Transposase DDE domain
VQLPFRPTEYHPNHIPTSSSPGIAAESVHVDKIYRTRANLAFCKANGIRISGPPLGRPPKNVSAETKKQARADESIRSTIEGKFGQGKRRFGLSRVMAKLAATSAAQISLSFLVLNLEAALRRILFALIILLTRHRLLMSSRHSPPSPQRLPSQPIRFPFFSAPAMSPGPRISTAPELT